MFRSSAPFLIHGGVVALLFFGWYWMNQRRDTLGELHPGGGPAYAVSPVHNIPIPQHEAPPNPVANDTESAVPSAPAKQEVEKKLPVPEKNAFEIPDKTEAQGGAAHSSAAISAARAAESDL